MSESKEPARDIEIDVDAVEGSALPPPEDGAGPRGSAAAESAVTAPSPIKPVPEAPAPFPLAVTPPPEAVTGASAARAADAGDERPRRPSVPVEVLAHALSTPMPVILGRGVAETAAEEVEEVEEIEAEPATPPPVPVAVKPSGKSVPPPPPPPEAAAAEKRAAPPPVLPPAAVVPEALAARPRKKKAKPWFEEVFDEDYLRTLPFMTPEQTLREVAFIGDTLQVAAGMSLLDVACGYGRHAIELAQRGCKVTGLDLSLPLLIRAADEAQRRGLQVEFLHADMREMAFDRQFDGLYCLLSSFGYFDEETNLKVATAMFQALKPGGRLLVDVLNRDYVVGDLPARVWWEGNGCVVLEEVDFNFHTSRVVIRRSVVFQDGRQVEQDISIRGYSLHELGKLMKQAGFRVLEVSGSLATRGRFFGATSRNIVMLCERPKE